MLFVRKQTYVEPKVLLLTIFDNGISLIIKILFIFETNVYTVT
jgi:hypothetical protein